MARLGRDLIADDGCEIIPHTHAPGRFRVVGQNVVVRGDAQFDAFTGQREHPLLNGRVAVMAVGEGVDVRVATDHARRRNFASNPHRQRVGLAGRQGELLSADAVLETARGIERVVAGRQSDAHRPAAGVNHARTKSEDRLIVDG